ncbi:hypothetical protein EVAR_54515_1 [Eumeta japonica]|uniref:Uncharacterized protein n=1 Tax=Eumeta variegata TaxID=151549 RepID=A0A4C1YKN2_EUMVA|nr:hypothetical protein EVAR_54515_1 [Eumeta japonica]
MYTKRRRTVPAVRAAVAQRKRAPLAKANDTEPRWSLPGSVPEEAAHTGAASDGARAPARATARSRSTEKDWPRICFRERRSINAGNAKTPRSTPNAAGGAAADRLSVCSRFRSRRCLHLARGKRHDRAVSTTRSMMRLQRFVTSAESKMLLRDKASTPLSRSAGRRRASSLGTLRVRGLMLHHADARPLAAAPAVDSEGT